MTSKNIYTSVACNPTPECADWGNNGLIAFGGGNAVAILDPKYDGNSAKILHTYVLHKKRVNTVRWLRETSTASESYIFSGADDGLAILWNVATVDGPITYQLCGHTAGVNALASLYRGNGDWLLATAAADSTLKLWHFGGTNGVCTQTISLRNGYCFTVRLALLPNTEQVILACSADDESIALWSQENPKSDTPVAAAASQFYLVHKLIGHEDWVRGLDFVEDGDDLLLASSSQDCFIRLWRIGTRNETQVRDNAVDIFDLANDTAGELRVEEKIVQLSAGTWCAVSLESVLYGHDGWVYGVHWYKSAQDELRLLSASIDKTLIVWAPTGDGVWMEQIRLGEVGGNSVGFFGGKFCSDGESIFGHSYQGGFHIWQRPIESENVWSPKVIISGHFGEVRDLAWEPQGQYLMTVSADQTTRIHAPWRRAQLDAEITWHELARPQVHGYDMQALAILSRYKFATGAEEKIVRTFQAPANFIENFKRITSIKIDTEGDTLLKNLPKGASVPSLGLSNKAVYNVDIESIAGEKHVKDEYPENYFVPIALDTPPQEETLMQNTLWPEVQKLYGHGFEIFALAASPDGNLLASSCRATSREHAQIILWNTNTWKLVQKLAPVHQLTVTQMRFSPDGRHLLSVSRDRSFAVFERQEPSTGYNLHTYELQATMGKAAKQHARIIWSCDWSHDSAYFATASRDCTAVIWAQRTVDAVTPQGWHSVDVINLLKQSITAIAFAPKCLAANIYVLALGIEKGDIQIYSFNGERASLCLHLPQSQAHHLTVKRLQFNPALTTTDNKFQLASCGEDHLVRIHEIQL